MRYNMVDRIGKTNLLGGNRTNYWSHIMFEVVLLSSTLILSGNEGKTRIKIK